ncbi:MAG TPA: WYL domain-containing protein [Vicinamibacterales bacterium]|nr:WYL domain-containing protein [Vicinamibacterales bacterium]
MPSTSARVLRLLSLLQVHREWSGKELARRLDVAVRTVRRDVDRLRQLGYSIDASAGVGGGYRLGPGEETPPLLLEDDEAVAVAVALGAAAGNAGSDVALRVLAKLDQLLPKRLRRKLTSVPAVTLSLVAPESTANLNVLATVASACRDTVQLRFSYCDMKGTVTTRITEPMRLVHTGRRWYLAAWDLGRNDWRTFRVDRIETQPRLVPGPRFTPRQPPVDFATMVQQSITSWPQPLRARVRLRESAASLRARLPSWVGTIEEVDERHCLLTVGGECPESLVGLILHTNVDFSLVDPPGAARPIRDIARRLLRGVSSAAGGRVRARRKARQ